MTAVVLHGVGVTGTGGLSCGGDQLSAITSFLGGTTVPSINWDNTGPAPDFCGHVVGSGAYDLDVTVGIPQGFSANDPAPSQAKFDYPVIVTITQLSTAANAPFSAVVWPRDLTTDTQDSTHWHLRLSVYVYNSLGALVDGSFSIAVYEFSGA